MASEATSGQQPPAEASGAVDEEGNSTPAPATQTKPASDRATSSPVDRPEDSGSAPSRSAEKEATPKSQAPSASRSADERDEERRKHDHDADEPERQTAVERTAVDERPEPESHTVVTVNETAAPSPGTAPEDDEEEEPSIFPYVYLPASKVYQPLSWQAVAFVLLFLAVMLVMCMVLTVTTWRYPDPETQLQLPDIALDTLPLMPELEHVTDLLLGLLVGMCFLTTFLLYLVAKGKLEPANKAYLEANFAPWDHVYFVCWIRFFVCYTAVTALRIIVVGSTVLPATNNKCKVRPDTGNFMWNSIVGVLSLGGSNVHCGDLLFSGHTSVITLAVTAVWTYSPVVTRWMRPISIVLMVFTWFTILASRSHYTDDIVVAFYFSVTLWILTPHDSIHGAPVYWHLFIQNPVGLYRAVQEAKAEREARRSKPPAAVVSQ